MSEFAARHQEEIDEHFATTATTEGVETGSSAERNEVNSLDEEANLEISWRQSPSFPLIQTQHEEGEINQATQSQSLPEEKREYIISYPETHTSRHARMNATENNTNYATDQLIYPRVLDLEDEDELSSVNSIETGSILPVANIVPPNLVTVVGIESENRHYNQQGATQGDNLECFEIDSISQYTGHLIDVFTSQSNNAVCACIPWITYKRLLIVCIFLLISMATTMVILYEVDLQRSLPASQSTASQPSIGPSAEPSPIEGIVSSFEWVQLGPAINGSAPDEFLGMSVATSKDNQIVVGGKGVVRLYSLNDNQEQWKIDADLSHYFQTDAFSLSLSADGTFLLVGEYTINESTGMAQVFHTRRQKNTENEKEWFRRGTPIHGNRVRDGFGVSCALTDNGMVIIVGTYGGDYVNIYRYNNHTWVVQEELQGSQGTDFGISLALAKRGNDGRLLVGAWMNNGLGTKSGSAFFYDVSLSFDGLSHLESEAQLIQTVHGKKPYDNFGVFVSLSADGVIASVGACFGNYVEVYQENIILNMYRQVGKTIEGAYGTRFGIQLNLSADGRRLVVGAPENSRGGDMSGMTFVYEVPMQTTFDDDAESDDMEKNEIILIGEFVGDAAQDQSGAAVALSDDGSKVVIGAFLNDSGGSNSGHVRVFAASLSD